MDDHALRAKKLLTLIGEKEERMRLARERREWRGALITAISAVGLFAAMGLGFLSLKDEIKTVGSTASQIQGLKEQMPALDQREQVTALGARIDQLSAAKAQLEEDIAQLKEGIETMKAEKKKTSLTRKR